MHVEHPDPDRERGSIMLVALWGIALIAALLTVAGLNTRTEVRVAANSIAASRARVAAEAGTQLGLARLLRRQTDVGAVFDGTPETWSDGGVTVEIAIADEGGKIDINQAPRELLTGLFIAVGRPEFEANLLACNILDRRGTPSPACPEPASSPIGRHRDYRFTAPEELAQLAGFDEALYDAIADSVTVMTGASAIDPLVAPRTVLLALPGATEGMVDSYISDRRSWRGMPGTNELLKAMPGAGFLTLSPRRDFTIRAVARAGAARYRAELQVRLTGVAKRPYAVTAWRAPPVDRGERQAAPARAP
jgi:general secretion pathway protein K